MSFEKYNQGVMTLDSEDNSAWIDMISCWVKKEQEYNIYIFQVIIEDETDLKNYYETITAAIATEFQINLEKTIEKWNIYLIFECKNTISEVLKEEVEQDKYSTRKMVWDSLEESELGDMDYLRDRLLYLNINNNNSNPYDDNSLLDKIKNIDIDLYQTIVCECNDIDEQVAIYLGGNIDEQED